MRNLFLYDQEFLGSQIRAIVNDSDKERWSDFQVYSAINLVLLGWEGNVSYPNYYDFSLASATYDYTLPTYIGDVTEVLWRADSDEKWEPIRYQMRKQSHNAGVITIEKPTTGSARVVWNLSNKIVPTTVGQLYGSIDEDDETISVSTSANIAESGYIKINSEILYYGEVTSRSETLVVLGSVVRGIQNTTANIADDEDNVLWCVAVDRIQAINELVYKAGGLLHGMAVSQNTPTSRQGDYSMFKAWTEIAERQANKSAPSDTIEIKGFFIK